MDSVYELIEAIRAQTEAINRLADSTYSLIEAIAAEHVDEDDAGSAHYLDGTPIDLDHFD